MLAFLPCALAWTQHAPALPCALAWTQHAPAPGAQRTRRALPAVGGPRGSHARGLAGDISGAGPRAGRARGHVRSPPRSGTAPAPGGGRGASGLGAAGVARRYELRPRPPHLDRDRPRRPELPGGGTHVPAARPLPATVGRLARRRTPRGSLRPRVPDPSQPGRRRRGGRRNRRDARSLSHGAGPPEELVGPRADSHSRGPGSRGPAPGAELAGEGGRS